jgi:eukaryotic-like serine/threonine-protein kinase
VEDSCRILTRSWGDARLVSHKELYRLSGKSRRGGCAEVFKAFRKEGDHEQLALKRPLKGPPDAAARLQREIEVQSSLAHPNIMRIVHSDPDMGWFVMPWALGTLDELREGVDEEELASLLMSAADALAVAHEGWHFHRDLKPSNILAMPEPQGTRKWVIADWGLVTLPYADGAIPLTRTGGLGTVGFTAPEVMADGRSATAASDVYSLGRIVMWYLDGGKVAPANRQKLPDGDKSYWRTFVRECTHDAPSQRPDLARFRKLLNDVFIPAPGASSKQAREVVNAFIYDQPAAIGDLSRLVAEHAQDADIFIDDLARLPSEVLQDWTRQDREGAAQAARQMCGHLTSDVPWVDRDHEAASDPLNFALEILKELAAQDEPGLVDDVALDFFKADMKWKLPRQHAWVRQWLSILSGRCAGVIALAMTRDQAIADHYRPLKAQDPGLATILTAQPSTQLP